MQLNQAEISQQNQQKYLISGVVDFSTVPDLMRRASGFLKSHQTAIAAQPASGRSTNTKNTATISVDMSQITACNSAGLALMLEMSEQARTKNITLHFENLPESLLTIAKAYGI